MLTLKNILILFALFLINHTVIAQIKFEKGYYIDNANQRIEGFIRNIDWKNNPTDFKFKTKSDSKISIIEITNAKEFGLLNGVKFKRTTVQIDRSLPKMNAGLGNLSRKRAPEFNEETLFLKVLIEGERNLYSYVDSKLYRYFFSTPEKEIEQLIFKKYLNEDQTIKTNNQFRQQLKNTLVCEGDFSINFNSINYFEKELITVFKKYNVCKNPDFNFTSSEKEKKDLFNLTLKPGIIFQSLSVDFLGPIGPRVLSPDFGNSTNFRFGIEAEFILGFNKNKWSITIEPMYSSYSEKVILISPIAGLRDIETESFYNYVDVNFGLRHYFFLNPKTKIFINSGFVLGIPTNSRITVEGRRDIQISRSSGFSAGIGLNHDRISIEGRLDFSRGITNPNPSSFKATSIILGYTLF